VRTRGLTKPSPALYEPPVSEDRKRAQQIGELIQHELANVITNELKDPRVGFVTVTEVRVTGDLRQARVFISVLGPPESRAPSLEGLRAAGGYLKHILGERLKLRFLPDLEFEVDATLDTAARLDTLMKAIAKGETETPAHEAIPAIEARNYRTELAEKRKTFSEQRKRAKPAGRPRGRSRR
jgi:ribosome-binding factor A